MTINCVVNNGIIQKLQVEEPSLDACVTIIPYYVDDQNINPVGAMLFASSKVKDGNLARLYFYDEKIPGFNKVYDDGTPLGIYRGSLIGPIKIWEIDYPANAKADDKYLEKSIYG